MALLLGTKMDAVLLERFETLRRDIDCSQVIAGAHEMGSKELVINFLITSACLLDSDFTQKEDIIEYAIETLLMQGPLSPYSDAIAEMHFREGEENTCFRGSKSPCGLVNPDSLCYINATLQLLYRVKPLREHLFSMNATSAQRCEPAREMAKIFAEMRHWLGFHADPTSLCRSMAKNCATGPYSDMSRSYDASAFLRDLIGVCMKAGEGVQEVWQCVTGSTTSTTVVQHADSRCIRTVREEGFQVLPLPCEYRDADGDVGLRTSSSVQESLGSFFREHALHTGGSCAERLNHLSPYMILQLKRFWFDREGMTVKKLHTPIEVEELLDTGHYFLPAREDGMQYRVRAIVVHTGEEEDGHYSCYIRQDDEKDSMDVWWRLDDEKAKRCGEAAAVLTSNEVRTGAFLLLYEAQDVEEVELLDNDGISTYLFDAVIARNERLCAEGLLGLYEGR